MTYSGGKDQCGSVLRTSEGEIETPDTDHDGSYDNDLNCNWTIETEQDKMIWLFVQKFDVEKEEQCRHDYMKV